MALLKVENLMVSYGMIQAINGVSFEVNKGEIIAILGANGAGKNNYTSYGYRTFVSEIGKNIFGR